MHFLETQSAVRLEEKIVLKTRPRPQSQELFEHIQAAPTGRIDRANGVIRGVKILGRSSRNGREYSTEAMQEAAKLYEGVAVNLNHPSRATPNASRPVEDGIGWLENVRVRADGVYGDLAVLKSHPRAESIFEFAERNPGRFGLSHNAAGNVVTRNGRQIVESVDAVRSVDLVQNPATNQSLFESEEPRRRSTKALKQFQEGVKSLISDRDLRSATRVKVLRAWMREEMDGPPDDGGESDPCEEIKTAIRAELTKPGATDEAKIQAVLAIIGGAEEGDSIDVPVDGQDMAEAYSDHRGFTRARRELIEDGGSEMLYQFTGRRIPGSRNAAQAEARAAELIKSITRR